MFSLIAKEKKEKAKPKEEGEVQCGAVRCSSKYVIPRKKRRRRRKMFSHEILNFRYGSRSYTSREVFRRKSILIVRPSM